MKYNQESKHSCVCPESKGIFLDSLEQFNPDLYCDFCGKSLSLEENIIVLYKVAKV